MPLQPLILATSYGPNHDFWAGEPWEWWVRGGLRFVVMNATTFLLLLAMWRRVHPGDWMRVLGLWLPVLLLGSYLTLGTIIYRDGDAPTAIGHRWGVRARLPMIGLAIVIGLRRAAAWGPSRRGFDVVLSARQDRSTTAAEVRSSSS